MKSSVFSSLLLVSLLLSVLFSPKVVVAQTLDPAQSVKDMQDLVQPVVTWASNWAYKVAFGITGLSFFYKIVIDIVKPPS